MFKKGHNGYKKKEYSGDKPYSRSQAISLYCVECNCGNAKAKKDCKATDCEIFPYHLGKKSTKDYTGRKVYTKAAAIKAFCTSCCGDSASIRKDCVDNSCFFYPYRNGSKDYTNYVKKTIHERVSF